MRNNAKTPREPVRPENYKRKCFQCLARFCITFILWTYYLYFYWQRDCLFLLFYHINWRVEKYACSKNHLYNGHLAFWLWLFRNHCPGQSLQRYRELRPSWYAEHSVCKKSRILLPLFCSLFFGSKWFLQTCRKKPDPWCTRLHFRSFFKRTESVYGYFCHTQQPCYRQNQNFRFGAAYSTNRTCLSDKPFSSLLILFHGF